MNRKMLNKAARPTWSLACLSLLLAGLLSLPSCKKEYFETDRIKDATITPEWAVPLINSTVTVPEVLDRFDDQDVITIDSTGILALRYFSNIFSVSAESVITVPDQSQSQGFPLTPAHIVTLTGNNPVTIPTVTYAIALDLSNMSPSPELHRFDFKSGVLTFQVTSQHTYPTDVRIRIPGLTQGGNPYDQNIVGVTSSNPQTVTVALAGWSLDLTQGSQGFNEIEVLADLTIRPGGIGVAGNTVDLNMSLTGPQYSLLLGDMKQQTFGVPASEVRIRFFENQQDGDIFWADPRVKAIFTNGIGADVRISAPQLDFQGASGTVALTGPLSNNPVLGHDPIVGNLFPTTLDLNRTNSNIVTVAATEPTKLLYEVSALTNPSGGSNLNWIKDTSNIRLDMEVFLPFDGTAVDFAKGDTAELDIFPLEGDVQEIERVTFRLTIDNGFPADAKAQVYFHDSTLTDSIQGNETAPIDSLFPDARAVVFASPTPDGSGRVDQNNKVRTVLDITVDRAKLERLEAGGFRAIRSLGWIDTYNLGSQNVQIYSNYEMDLYLGVMVKFKAKFGL